MSLSARIYGIAVLSGVTLFSGCMPAYRAAPEQAQIAAPSGWIGRLPKVALSILPGGTLMVIRL